jgi:hypothetical protein
MNVIIALKVFKNSSLITPQGEFKISRVFPSAEDAGKTGYVRHCTSSGVDIYTKKGGAAARFAVIGK